MQSLDPEHYVAFHACGANNIAAGCEFLVGGVHRYHDLLERMRDITNPPYAEPQYRTGGYLCGRWAGTFDSPWSAEQGHYQIDLERLRRAGAGFFLGSSRYWFDRAA